MASYTLCSGGGETPEQNVQIIDNQRFVKNAAWRPRPPAPLGFLAWNEYLYALEQNNNL